MAQKKKKAFLIGILAVCASLIFVGAYLFFQASQDKALYNDALSQRGKEYILSQKESGELTWSSVNTNLQKGAVLGEQSIAEKGCFSLSTVSRAIKKLGPCFYEIALLHPRALVIVYEKDAPSEALAGNSAVVMRRQNKTKYKEGMERIGEYEYTTFTLSDLPQGGYEKSALRQHNGKLFVLTLSSQSSQSLDSLFRTILSSVSYNEE